MKKIKELEKLATEMAGDGKSPNVYFVSVEGEIVLVTRFFQAAHTFWRHTATNRVSSLLEDRKTGVIASAGKEPTYNPKTEDFDGPEAWQVHDDSITFGFINRKGDYIK